ncbi:DEAD/DEAH box helicase [Roseiterribacter gracilis]|uniref:DEAD/DEAH box helicase n=1 Tax=Roseiterribacter gracilis TaxID=2812848 RepID=A0A8S8XHW2_9PROT|nr:DEAD/DEAH box helicase [Rhodospirillales bacterium TMPK1]
MPFPTLPPALQRALTERGYAEPTPVQEAVLQGDYAGRDLLVSARTGSGKTVAFGLAAAPSLLDGDDRMPPPGAPIALMIAPTRELAMQVAREIDWLYQGTGARVVSCVGGMDARRESRQLDGGVHIVVGTPGRLRDHLERGALVLDALRVVVLDEADEMLDLGFRDELEAILDATPATRRTLLFSATLPKEIVNLARRYQKDAERISVASDREQHSDIEYRVVEIAPHETEPAVVNLLRWFELPAALVFCATREQVKRLHGILLERGFSAVALSGEMSQAERTHALQALRDGHARVCVCTDVAARGLDLPDLGLVIQAELPRDRQVFQHRSGRTGRAGKKGVSVLLAPYPRRRAVERLLQISHIDAQWSGPPDAEQIRVKDRERLLAKIAPADPSDEELVETARLVAEGRSAEDLAATLVRLYRDLLPAPDDLDERGSARGEVRERAPRERRERAPRDGGMREPRPDPSRAIDAGDAVWFRLNVGRNGNADPRWLLPFLCRRGHVTKREIGQIEIRERETRVAISRDAAERFAVAAKRPDPQDPNLRIDPVTDEGVVGDVSQRRGPKPDRGRPEKSPYEKPRGQKPSYKSKKR